MSRTSCVVFASLAIVLVAGCGRSELRSIPSTGFDAGPSPDTGSVPDAPGHDAPGHDAPPTDLGPPDMAVPVCGDHVCGPTEDCNSCAQDCGMCHRCGDMICEPALMETCMTCPCDSGAHGLIAGDGI